MAYFHSEPFPDGDMVAGPARHPVEEWADAEIVPVYAETRLSHNRRYCMTRKRASVSSWPQATIPLTPSTTPLTLKFGATSCTGSASVMHPVITDRSDRTRSQFEDVRDHPVRIVATMAWVLPRPDPLLRLHTSVSRHIEERIDPDGTARQNHHRSGLTYICHWASQLSTVRALCSGKTLAFQANDAGSIPAARSSSRDHTGSISARN